jgi:AcrR family transcriptional regulator
MSHSDMTRLRTVGRWEADARGRLRTAALALYAERGFEQTTVSEIAERAGLNARTFFRYFTDKREVLFAGSEPLQDAVVEAVTGAPHGATPAQVVAAVLDVAGDRLGQHRELSRQRQALISANPELHERELIKLARLSAAVADGLRRRGVPEPDASLAAEAGTAVLRVGFARWLEDPGETSLTTMLRATLDRLPSITAVPGTVRPDGDAGT